MNRIFLCLAFAACSFTLFSQTKADEWFDKKEYRQAVKDYKALIKTTERSRKPSSEKLRHFYTRLGESYLYLRDYASAEHCLAKAKQYGAEDTAFLLNCGHAFLANDKADSALMLYRQVLQQTPENSDVQEAIRKAELNLALSAGSEAKLNPVTLQSQLNMSSNQYALSWYKGALLFSSDRSTPKGGKETAPSHFFYSQPIYDFNLNQISGWDIPEKLTDIETDDAFVHSFAYDEQTSTYYVMQSLITANAEEPRCDIYAYRAGANGKISKPMQQSFQSPDGNIGHPTLSSDGNVMIFSSTIAGNSNLYIVKKTGENTWTAPLLLDSTINSDCDEAYPQFFHDSLLFFSSGGHRGMGGMDIFYTKISVGNEEHAVSGNSDLATLTFSPPVNLGIPINSGGDDVAFLLKPDAYGGFFISNRTVNGQNRSQIYYFENTPYALNLSGTYRNANRFGNTQIPVITMAFVMPQNVDTDKSKLNAEIARLNAQIFDFNSQVSKLNNEVSENNNQKWNHPADIAALKTNRLRINAEKSRLNDEIRQLGADIANYNAELKKLNEKDPKPNDERSRLDNEIALQNAEITAQNAGITGQNNRIAGLNDNLAEFIDRFFGINREIAKQEAELEKLNTKTSKNAAEKAQLDAERERIKAAIAKLRAEREKLNRERENHLADKFNAVESYAKPYQNLGYSNDEIARLNAEIVRLQAENDTKRFEDIKTPAITVTFVMPHRMDTDKAKLNAEVAKLNARVFALNAQVSEINNEIAGNSNKKLGHGADIATLRANGTRLNAEKSQLNDEINHLNADITNYHAQLNKFNNKELKQNDKRSQLDDEIALKNAEITAQNAEITKQNNQIAQLNNDLDILIETLLDLYKEIADLESGLGKLNTKSPKNAAEKAQLDAERERIKAAIAKLRAEREKLNKERENFNADKSRFIEAYAKQHQHLTYSNDEIARLNAEIDRLNAEIERLRAENAANPDTVYVDRIVEVPVEVFVGRAVQGEAMFMKNIYFANNSAKLEPESKAELDRFVKAMLANPKTRFEISGHTDFVGTLKYNQWLSKERAKAVCSYLIEHGVRANRLTSVGYNYSRPVAPNSTPEGRSQNRRIEIKIL